MPPLPRPRRSRESVLRRAWGAYYLIWASAVFLFQLIGAYASVMPSTANSRAEELAAYLLVALVAGMVTLRYFREVWQETHFPLWKVGRGFLASFALFMVGLTVGVAFAGPVGIIALAAVLVVVAVILAYQLRWSLGFLPWDGGVAVGSLLLGALGSTFAVLLTGNILAYGFFWLVTVVVWAGCAVAAFVRSDPLPARSPPARSS